MASITLRTVKGSPLSNQEMDDNFNNINVQLNAALPAATYTAADVLSKLLTVDGSGSGLDADLLDGYTSSTSATGNTIVLRNASGDITAGTVNATFDNLAALYAVNPHPEYARTFIESVDIAALFEAYVNTITLENVASPESNVTPDSPPTEVGNIQLNPVAFEVVAAV